MVFSNVTESDKKSVRGVCNKWHDMNPIDKMVIKYKNDEQERIIQDVKNIQPKELLLYHCHDIPERFSIKDIIDNTRDLKKLKIKACYLPRYDYDFNTHVFQNLSELKIVNTRIILNKFSNEFITLLNIRDCGINRLDLNCPNLIDLDLSCNELNQININCIKLHTLDISYNNFTQFQINTPNLIDLDLQECHELNHFDCSIYPKLEYLNVSISNIFVTSLSNLKYLKCIEISSNHVVDVSNISKKCIRD